jgi:hypothetical protein
MTESILESIDSPEETAAQLRREEASAAAPFWFKNIQLHPLAVGREGDWLLHCRRIGLPPLTDVINDVETFIPHAGRLLFFLAHPPGKWLASWMVFSPSVSAGRLDLQIREWIDEHIKPGPDVSAAVNLALAIYDRAHELQPAIADDPEGGGDELGEGRGLRHERRSSPSSRRPSTAVSAPSTSNTNTHPKRRRRSSIVRESRAASSTSGPRSSPRKKQK